MSKEEIEKLPGFWCWSQKGYPIFGGPTRYYEDNSDILPSREIQQETLDILDDKPQHTLD